MKTNEIFLEELFDREVFGNWLRVNPNTLSFKELEFVVETLQQK
jgi:hypothetical protein